MIVRRIDIKVGIAGTKGDGAQRILTNTTYALIIQDKEIQTTAGRIVAIPFRNYCYLCTGSFRFEAQPDLGKFPAWNGPAYLFCTCRLAHWGGGACGANQCRESNNQTKRNRYCSEQPVQTSFLHYLPPIT